MVRGCLDAVEHADSATASAYGPGFRGRGAPWGRLQRTRGTAARLAAGGARLAPAPVHAALRLDRHAHRCRTRFRCACGRLECLDVRGVSQLDTLQLSL